MSLRTHIHAIVNGMPPGSSVSLPVSWLRELLEMEPVTANGGELMTLEDVADRVGVAESTVRSWCNSGKLEAFKLNGRAWRVRESALNRYLERQESPEPEGPALGRATKPDLGSWRKYLPEEEENSVPDTVDASRDR